MKKNLTAERLRELLHYDPETGVFTRVAQRGDRFRPGERAGSLIKATGYVCVGVDGKQYQAHRLAVLYMTGRWPAAEVDHINGVRPDNRWANLRECTAAENRQNQSVRSDNTSGATGVIFDKRVGKWLAQIKIKGKNHRVGHFNDMESAKQAYAEAKARLHVFAPCVAPRRSNYGDSGRKRRQEHATC